MAKLTFDNNQEESKIEVQTQTPSVEINISDSTPIETQEVYGLNQTELNDKNQITVTIADKIAPLIILFGPAACGKTMTLVRLTRYLHVEGYEVKPIKSFRPAYDEHYKEMCVNYDIMINSNNAAKATRELSFMLVSVLKNGKQLCQILEAPGEYYFNPKKPKEQFPNYLNTIINSTNRKIWLFFTEPNWLDTPDRSNYATKIKDLKKRLRPRDKAVFVFNKIDDSNFAIGAGNVRIGLAKKDVADNYQNIFVPFTNQNPITKWWKEFLFDFAPFYTGDFTKAGDELTYQEGPIEYPRNLWNIILKRIRG